MHLHRCHLSPLSCTQGILYGQPRGELVGSAEFIDQRHKLVGTVTFGEIKGAVDPLLRRADTISCTIHKQQAPSTNDAVPSAMQVRYASTCTARHTFEHSR